MRGWLTPKPDPEFETKCADICTVYQDAPAAAQQDVRTVSIDEMTGVQALERAAPWTLAVSSYVRQHRT